MIFRDSPKYPWVCVCDYCNHISETTDENFNNHVRPWVAVTTKGSNEVKDMCPACADKTSQSLLTRLEEGTSDD